MTLLITTQIKMDKLLVLAVTIAVLLTIGTAYPTINQDENNPVPQGDGEFEVMAKKKIVKRDPPPPVILDIVERLQVRNELDKQCLYFLDDRSELQLIKCDPTCGTKFTVTHLGVKYFLTIGCASDEENYLGLCYKKCSLLANANYPLRTATNTCAKDGCGPDEEQDAGLCYPKCEDYYNGVGPVCWGHCDHFCPDHEDHGAHCYRWWPPHSCPKPSYGRGVGTLPNAPWTNGFGCNGFGVANDGGCARRDVSFKISCQINSGTNF